MITRRQFTASTPLLVAGTLSLSGCSPEPASDRYEAVAKRTWRPAAVTNRSGATLGKELVRHATLAPSSHNKQCWKFALAANDHSISILPDLARRCPAVDPDDHHVFVSLGCATEHLIQAALAYGLKGEAQFDAAGAAVRVLLEPTRAQTTPLYTSIPLRHCTRGDYDGKALSTEELALLQRAGSSDTVRLLLLTERRAMEQTLEYVIQGNSVQLADAAFVKEPKEWIRLNGPDAVRISDGLYSASSGNPNIPSWIGDLAFRWLLTAKGENEEYARQVRSSAGIAGQRPDLVVRFGRGPTLPRSLRRPVQAVPV
jgi:hypothetical protein